MTEIGINTIDNKYLVLADKLTKPAPTDDKIKYDVYNNLPLRIESIDYGYITMIDGSIRKMFIATSEKDTLKCNSLYFSDDGLNWSYLDFPTADVTYSYSKILIFEGSAFVLCDDKLCRFYDFDFDNSEMKEDTIEGESYDLIISKNKLYALAHNGIYNIHKVDDVYEYSDLIQISQDFVFEKFIKSTSDELIIMGYAEMYPVFINIFEDGGVQPIFCTYAFNIQTAISYKEYIYCYTTDARIVTVYKSPSIDKTVHMIYDGYHWSGEIVYYHSHFWIAYTEFIENNAYTYIAKSSNGLDFDADVRIPRMTESDGLFAIACNTDMNDIICIGAGDIYTLIPSVNYFDYGKCVKFTNRTELTDSFSVSIDDFEDPDNFRNYNINVYVVYKDTVLDKDVKFDIAPHVEDGNIVFKIQDKEYEIPEEPEPYTPDEYPPPEEESENNGEENVDETDDEENTNTEDFEETQEGSEGLTEDDPEPISECIKILTVIYGVRTVC